MKNILIFGGCGFLGSWIVKALLKKNLEITIFDLIIKTDLLKNLIGNELKKIKFIEGDITDYEQVLKDYGFTSGQYTLSFSCVSTQTAFKSRRFN